MTRRLYGPLNDFLPCDSRQRDVVRDAPLPCSVKDLLESSGVPHPEIGLILIDGGPVGFEAPVPAGARIAAYTTLVRLDASALPALRPPLPSPPAFVLDGHLGTLARRLRLAGLKNTDNFSVLVKTNPYDKTRTIISQDELRKVYLA